MSARRDDAGVVGLVGVTWLELFAFGGAAAKLPCSKKADMLSTSIGIIEAQGEAGATTGFATGEGVKDSSILEEQDCNGPGEEKGLAIPSKWFSLLC